MSGYGNGLWERVQAPEILMATLSNSAAANTLGRSSNGFEGAGGTKGWANPTWSIMTCVSGLRRGQFHQQWQLARSHNIDRETRLPAVGQYGVEAGMVCVVVVGR